MTVVAENLAREFAAIDEYLKAVTAILLDGHMPDLAGLDERVSALCTSIQKADPEIQQQFLAKMNELLRKLDACENDIRAFHAALTKGKQ